MYVFLCVLQEGPINTERLLRRSKSRNTAIVFLFPLSARAQDEYAGNAVWQRTLRQPVAVRVCVFRSCANVVHFSLFQVFMLNVHSINWQRMQRSQPQDNGI